MSLSIQTNVDSIMAQENLRVNSAFQSQTIQRVTSGFRINSSGDDAAGLAVANGYRTNIAELTQGVRNANDGISTLQIVDGGLSNIAKMLDRLKTLATESASETFTGDRATLDNEFQTLMGEINRQSENINLGDTNNLYSKKFDVYIGGGHGTTNAAVTVDLAGSKVSSTGLGLSGLSITGGNTVTMGPIQTAMAAGDSDTFTVTTASGTYNFTVNGGGTTADQVANLNTQLSAIGVGASVDSNNNLQFTSSNGFSITSAESGAGLGMVADTTKVNTSMYNASATFAAANLAGSFDLLVNGKTYNVTYGAAIGGSQAATDAAVSAINTQLSNHGLNLRAMSDSAGTAGKIVFEGSQSFSFANMTAAAFSSAPTLGPAPTAGNLKAADTLVAINAAVQTLGQVQGKVGTGENQLQYAINLAQSQIASFSAAESRIRDTDIATEASNLTKGQVLMQSSLAALAQANQAPQALLALLKG